MVRTLFRLFLISASVCSAGYFLFYGKEGIIASCKLRDENIKLEEKIFTKKHKLESLLTKVEALKNDDVLLENKIRRTTLLGHDETIYVIPQ